MRTERKLPQSEHLPCLLLVLTSETEERSALMPWTVKKRADLNTPSSRQISPEWPDFPPVVRNSNTFNCFVLWYIPLSPNYLYFVLVIRKSDKVIRLWHMKVFRWVRRFLEVETEQNTLIRKTESQQKAWQKPLFGERGPNITFAWMGGSRCKNVWHLK